MRLQTHYELQDLTSLTQSRLSLSRAFSLSSSTPLASQCFQYDASHIFLIKKIHVYRLLVEKHKVAKFGFLAWVEYRVHYEQIICVTFTQTDHRALLELVLHLSHGWACLEWIANPSLALEVYWVPLEWSTNLQTLRLVFHLGLPLHIFRTNNLFDLCSSMPQINFVCTFFQLTSQSDSIIQQNHLNKILYTTQYLS